MEQFWSDLKFGIRLMVRNPSFAAIAILALALGIGANTAIFTVVDAIVLKPLPYRNPDRLVLLRERSPNMDQMSVAYPNFVDWRQQQQVFDKMSAVQSDSLILTGVDQPERIRAANVTHELFDVLGARIIRGRMFTADEDKPGSRVIVVSHNLWKNRFASDPNIIGRQLRLSGDMYTVIGVAEPGFSYPIGITRTDIWAPLGRLADRPNVADRGNHPGIYVVARLKSNVSIEQARHDLDRVAANLARAFAVTNKTQTIGVDTLLSTVIGNLQTAGYIVLGAVTLVLLIACANVANLLLARATGRNHEIAVRTAVGAGRGRIIRQLLTESLLLSLFSGALGFLIAYWGVDALRLLIPQGTPRADEVAVNGRVLGFTFFVSILTGFLFGLVPAFEAAKSNLNDAMKEGARRATGSQSRQRWRNALIVGEIALSVVLLVGAGLLMQSFVKLVGTSPGINAVNVSIGSIALRGENYKEPVQFAAFARRALDNVQHIAGVDKAAIATFVPFFSSNQTGIYLEGQPNSTPQDRILCDWSRVTPDYFKTLGIHMVEGRSFDEHDNENGRLVGIIDETMARKYFPGSSAIGKKFYWGATDKLKTVEIIGIAAHVKHYGADQPSRFEAYIPYYQDPVPTFNLVIHSTVDSAAIQQPLRAAVSRVDRDVPVYNQSTMEAFVALAMTTTKVSSIMFALFASVAMVLSAIGIYGVISYSVTQRTQEIGIRMALGAGSKDVLSLVFGQGGALIGIGVAVGLVGAVGLSRVLSGLLYSVSVTDVRTFVVAPLVLACIAALATFMPARRAMSVDPMQALRHE